MAEWERGRRTNGLEVHVGSALKHLQQLKWTEWLAELGIKGKTQTRGIS